MRMIGRFVESEDPVLFARFGEVDKCEFIKVNAPKEAWASTDDGAGLLVKVDALREQAREVLVSAARCRAPTALTCFSNGSNHCRRYSPPPHFWHHHRPASFRCRTRTDVINQRPPHPAPPLALLRGKACGLQR